MPKIESLMLANHAEVANGLLYISGGGWTEHWRPTPGEGQAPLSNIGIAVTILVPWNETNRQNRFGIRIEPEDGGAEIMTLEADFETGRPPGLSRGSDQRVSMAFNANLVFPKAGGYSLKARAGEDEQKSVSFRVHDRA